MPKKTDTAHHPPNPKRGIGPPAARLGGKPAIIPPELRRPTPEADCIEDRFAAPILTEAHAKCERYGFPRVLDEIRSGIAHREIAEKIGVAHGAMWTWMGLTKERIQARARARSDAAVAYDELAEYVLRTAEGTATEIQRAAQLAQHYRWRAKVVNPRDYGDKVEVEHRIGLADAVKAIRDRAAGEADVGR